MAAGCGSGAGADRPITTRSVVRSPAPPDRMTMNSRTAGLSQDQDQDQEDQDQDQVQDQDQDQDQD
ncbi:hypothetical protein EYF80_020865 [Liparis tanakae]|uniref:Uncharacterized protein n=1 Tax=Liparis tanakae TaxID=230148 RepID=A0A4Z2HT54_9TELE|nr:hypothetical protein EYF80_020865 [Liparis tanakae]